MENNNIIIQQLANKFANNYVNGKQIQIPSMKFSDWSILLRMIINNVKNLNNL